MKWRKITEEEARLVISNPDMLVDTIKGRKNAFKIIGGRHLKITYRLEGEILTLITAMAKGE